MRASFELVFNNGGGAGGVVLFCGRPLNTPVFKTYLEPLSDHQADLIIDARIFRYSITVVHIHIVNQNIGNPIPNDESLAAVTSPSHPGESWPQQWCMEDEPLWLTTVNILS